MSDRTNMTNQKNRTRQRKNTNSTLGVRRYRAIHRRIDYVPSIEALAVIERHLAAGLSNCLAGVIDDLIAAGDEAISGNG